jgi:hypothetical protein
MLVAISQCSGSLKIRIICKDPDPYQTVGSNQIEKQDPDPYQSEKHYLDPYQKGLDPQHYSISQCCGSASASAWIRMVLVSWIRIRNPHSKCGFQMRMRIRDKLRKNSTDDKKI